MYRSTKKERKFSNLNKKIGFEQYGKEAETEEEQ
jgi:hypothetical protein